MADTTSAESYRSRYGIEKLQDHNYHTWSFQCQMLLAEKKVWDIVDGKSLRPKSFEELTDDEKNATTAAAKKAIEKTVSEWEERNAEALRIISFMVIDRLQGPILYGKNAKGAWEELQKVHAPKAGMDSVVPRSYSVVPRSGHDRF